jgi:hypothetical protein
MKIAPKAKFAGGEPIDLKPYLGQACAVKVVGRSTVETKFGPRQMSEVRIVSPDADGVVEGVLFQSYFKQLDLNEWYAGRLEKIETNVGSAWILTDKLSKKEAAALKALTDAADAATDDDVPF